MATTTSGKIKLGLALDPAACQLLQQMAAGPRGLGAFLEDLLYAEAERRKARAPAEPPAPATDSRLLAEVEQGRAQLLQLSRRLVEIQEEERRTLSRDLHDTSAQSLTALKLGLASLQRAAARADGPEIVRGRVEGLLKLADAVTEDLHRLAVNLRPASLDRYGLVPALEQLLIEFRKQSGLPVSFEAHAAGGHALGRLPDDVETTLYRIVQESLTNVARHAAAHAVAHPGSCNVAVRLETSADGISLTVTDTGPGFDVEPELASGRLGLLGMRERAAMLGGSLTIESTPGQGATIHASIPVASHTPDLTGVRLPQQGPVTSLAQPESDATDPHLTEAAELARAKVLSDALIDLTAQLAGCGDADEILRLVLAQPVAAIGREIAHITQREGAGWRITYRYPDQLTHDFYEDAESGAWNHVERTRAVLVVDDALAPDLAPELRMPGERWGIKSYACIPLLAGPRFLGVLSFASVASVAPFHRTEVEFLNRLCVIVSLALDNVLLREAEARQRDELARRVSELQAVAARLQQAEAQARDLIEHAPSAIYELDLASGKFVSVNDAMCQMLGYTRAELLGMSAFDLMDAANRAKLLERQRRALTGEAVPTDFEYEVRRKDGRLLYGSLHMRLLYASGQPVRAYVIAHDVTERHRAAEALAQHRSQSERLAAELETVLTSIPTGLVVYDSAGRIARMNRRAEDILGFSEEVRSLPYDQRVPTAVVGLHGDGTPFARDEYPTVRALRGEVVRNVEMMMRVPDRVADAWVSVSSGPIYGADGEIAGAVTTFTDVSGVHRLNEELARTNADLEAILAAVPVGLIVYDAEGNTLRASETARRTVGWRAEGWEQTVAERVGATVQLRSATGGPLARGAYPAVRALAGEGISGQEYFMHFPDDPRQDRWAVFASAPIRSRGGAITGALITWADTTALHVANEALRVAKAELESQAGALREAAIGLEQRVQARTAELSAANAQLAAANAQLGALSRRLVERQERERSYVADRLYNEAAQVIASFKWQAELLSREARRNAAPTDWLDDLTANMDRALVELHSLASDLRPAVLDRAGLAAAVQQYAAAFAARHGVAVDCRVEGLRGVRLPEEAETAVYRVLEEALTNVGQHAHASRVTVTLSRKADCVCLEVADDGVGFDLAAAEVHEGVGLTAMRERAAALHGRLEIVSAPGAGARVTVEAPMNP